MAYIISLPIQEKTLKVILANKAGFCMGVRRAMDTISALPFDKSEVIYSDGPVIHNPQVIEVLKKRNILPLLDKMTLSGKKVIVRTHGITPERRKFLQDSGAVLLDVTCPRVRQIQKIIEQKHKDGYGIVIYGDSDHSEVKGLLGYAENQSIALQSVTNNSQLPHFKKVAVVSQSTRNRQDYEKFTQKLKGFYKDLEIFDTLCDSTACRQTEALQLAEQSDAIVVVGGLDSANTKTLAAIARQSGKPVFHIETENELVQKNFRNFSSIGLTAGASTPNWMINRVYERLYSMKGRDESWFSYISRKIGFFLAYSNLLLSISAIFLSYASAILMGLNAGWKQLIIAPLYIYSMHLLNIFVDFKSIEINQPSRANFFKKYKKILVFSAILSAMLSASIAATLKPETLLVISIALVLGIIYSRPILPEKWQPSLRLMRLRDIPGSKNILVAAAWAAMTSLIYPISTIGIKVSTPSSIAAFIWVFSVVAGRMIVNDIRYLHGDAVIGHGTLPVLVGFKTAKKSLRLISFVTAGILIFSTIFKFLPTLGFFMLIPLAYSLFYQSLLFKRKVKSDLAFEIIMDLELLLCGITAFIWKNLL
jgi:(E)-4-hydroxy-3-methyl-but-2-enyl pyrophosphate reductase